MAGVKTRLPHQQLLRARSQRQESNLLIRITTPAPRHGDSLALAAGMGIEPIVNGLTDRGYTSQLPCNEGHKLYPCLSQLHERPATAMPSSCRVQVVRDRSPCGLCQEPLSLAGSLRFELR